MFISIFSNNSEAYASELLENIEKIIANIHWRVKCIDEFKIYMSKMYVESSNLINLYYALRVVNEYGWVVGATKDRVPKSTMLWQLFDSFNTAHP